MTLLQHEHCHNYNRHFLAAVSIIRKRRRVTQSSFAAIVAKKREGNRRDMSGEAWLVGVLAGAGARVWEAVNERFGKSR